MQQVGIRVLDFVIMETGTYNEQFRRPYKTELDAFTQRAIAERVEGANGYSATMFSGVANQFVAPSATPESQLVIANGWQQRRLRWVLKLERNYATGASVMDVLTGYTDFNGITLSGAIAPEMSFIINNHMSFRKNIERTPFGQQVYYSPVRSSQILVDQQWSGIGRPGLEQKMRPTDVFATMGRAHLSGIGHVMDIRSTLDAVPIKSKRSNNNASSYMADILHNQLHATRNNEGMGGSYEEMLTAARGATHEDTAQKDPFMSAIAQISGRTLSNIFNFDELCRLDPNVRNVMTYVTSQNTTQVSPMGPIPEHHTAGDTSGWHGSDRHTQVATILSQSIPALMMDRALTTLAFRATNMDFGSGGVILVENAQGFIPGDLSAFVEAFKQDMLTKVLPDISYNNQMSYALEANVNLFGETWLNLTIDGVKIPFVTPQFCDALMTPVLTQNQEAAMTLATDFDQVFTGLHGDCMGDGSYAMANGVGALGSF